MVYASGGEALGTISVYDQKGQVVRSVRKGLNGFVEDVNTAYTFTGAVEEATADVNVGYGRTIFFKKVKQLTGLTPNDYIRQQRMSVAIELLKDTRLTVAEVAYKVGFEDQYYFSKSFKSYFGISPSQYRKGETPKQSQ